jgi:hypothetical protein
MRIQGLAAVSCLAMAGFAQAATFTKLADTSTPAGDGSTLRIFNTPELAGKTALFIAQSVNGLVALYAVPTAGGTLVKLADTNTKVPGGTGDFTVGRVDYFTPFRPAGCNAPVVGSSSAVFVGLDAALNEGLYSVPLAGGKIVKLGNAKTAIPGGPLPNNGPSTFGSTYAYCHVAVSGTTVVFDAGSNSGIYTVQTNAKKLGRIADANTPYSAPPPFPVVNGYGLPWIKGKTATYIGSTTGGPFGIFAGPTTGLGAPVISAASSEANDFDQFAFPVISSTNILFSALANGNDSVLVKVGLDGTGTTTIFDVANSPVPAGALGSNFNQLGTDSENFLGNDGARQIFTAYTYDAPPADYATYEGVYSSCKGKLTKVLETGDALGALQIRAVGGISQLQQVKVDGLLQDQFAVMLTLGPPGQPSLYNGAPALYTVNLKAC